MSADVLCAAFNHHLDSDGHIPMEKVAQDLRISEEMAYWDAWEWCQRGLISSPAFSARELPHSTLKRELERRKAFSQRKPPLMILKEASLVERFLRIADLLTIAPNDEVLEKRQRAINAVEQDASLAHWVDSRGTGGYLALAKAAGISPDEASVIITSIRK